MSLKLDLKKKLFWIFILLSTLPLAAEAEESLGSSFLSTLSNAATTVSKYTKGKLGFAKQLLPFSSFIFYLPQNLISSLSNNSYNKNIFTILNQNKDDAQLNYGVEINFNFEGSGDSNQPICFTLYNGRFYFKKTDVQFVPKTFILKNDDGTTEQSQRTDIRDYPFSIIIPNLLQQFFGNDGVNAWRYVNRLLNPYPEDVFAFKLLSLIFSAIQNQRASKGYPRIEHIPLEMVILFDRLSKTPNITATRALYPAGTRSNAWDPNKIVYLGSAATKGFLESLPQTLQDFINNIQLTIPEGELQEYKDLIGKDIISGQKLYGDFNLLENYDERTMFIRTDILPFIKNSNPTKTEINLLIYTIKRHYLERLKHLQQLLLITFDVGFAALENLMVANTNANQFDLNDPTAEVTSNAPDMEALRTRLVDVNAAKIRQILFPRYNQLKNLLLPIQEVLTAKQVFLEDIDFFQKLQNVLDKEMEEVAVPFDDLAKAIVSGDDASFNVSHEQINRIISELFFMQINLIYSVAWGAKIQIPAYEYLKVNYFKFELLKNIKYDGDFGYFKDDSTLGLIDTLMNSVAIILRAKNDLMLAESIFKADMKGQYMISPNGQRELIKGAITYQNLYEKPLYEKNRISDQLDKLKAQASTNMANSGILGSALQSTAATSPALIEAEKQLEVRLNDAQKQFSTLNATYTHYLRQLRFDRRKKTTATIGKPFDPNIFKEIIRSKEVVLAEDLNKDAHDLINEYSLVGSTALLRIDILLLQKKIEQLLMANEEQKTATLTQTLTDKNALIQKYQTDLEALTKLKTDYQTKLTAMQTATTAASTTEQDLLKQEVIKVEEGINTRNTSINTTKSEAQQIELLLNTIIQKKTAYLAALENAKQLAKNKDLKATTLADIFAANLPLQNIRVDLDATELNDKDYLALLAAATKLVLNAAEMAITAATPAVIAVENAALTFDSTVFEQVMQRLEKALSINSESLFNGVLQNAKAEAAKIPDAIISGDLNFNSIEAKLLANLKPITNPKELANSTGLCVAVARATVYSLVQLLSSSVGLPLFTFLKQQLLPEWLEYIAGNPPVKSVIRFDAIDSVDALIAAASPAAIATPAVVPVATTATSAALGTTATTIVPAATAAPTNTGIVPPAVNLQNELNAFIQLLQTALQNAEVWQNSFWEHPVFITPKSLPLDGSARLHMFGNAISKILQDKKEQITLPENEYKLLQALIYGWRQLYGQSKSNLSGMLIFVESWMRKISINAASGNQQDLLAYQNIKQLWNWLKTALPQLFSYARYFMEAGIYTSINDFLVKEFANMLYRSKGFGLIASMYLDPILIRALGVNMQTLLQASDEERKKIVTISQENLLDQLANMGLKMQNQANQINAQFNNNLESLQGSLNTALENNLQNVTNVNADIQKQVALINTLATTPIADAKAMDAFFNNTTNKVSGLAVQVLDPNTVGDISISDSIPGSMPVNQPVTNTNLQTSVNNTLASINNTVGSTPISTATTNLLSTAASGLTSVAATAGNQVVAGVTAGTQTLSSAIETVPNYAAPRDSSTESLAPISTTTVSSASISQVR